MMVWSEEDKNGVEEDKNNVEEDKNDVQEGKDDVKEVLRCVESFKKNMNISGDRKWLSINWR